jgi:hypothetical protein
MYVNCPDTACNGLLGIFNLNEPLFAELSATGDRENEIASKSLRCPACHRFWEGTITYRQVPPDRVGVDVKLRIATAA